MANSTGIKHGGRQKGTPNRLTREVIDILKDAVCQELSLVQENLSKLDPKDRIDLLIKLIPFVCFTDEIKPTEQVRAQAYFVAEVNQFRKTTNYPKCEYYFVVMDFDNFPYNIYNVTTTFGTGEVIFNKLGTASNEAEYLKYFTTSSR